MKKKQKPRHLQGISDMIQGEAPPFLLICIDVLCNHSVGLNAFGCSISSPDEYSCAVTPQVRQTGNRLSGLAGTAYASLLA